MYINRGSTLWEKPTSTTPRIKPALALQRQELSALPAFTPHHNLDTEQSKARPQGFKEEDQEGKAYRVTGK